MLIDLLVGEYVGDGRDDAVRSRQAGFRDVGGRLPKQRIGEHFIVAMKRSSA
jgi:hypothetical protein